MSMITVAEAAEKWGISVQLVRRFCRENRISDAVMYEGIWFIPDDKYFISLPHGLLQSPFSRNSQTSSLGISVMGL